MYKQVRRMVKIALLAVMDIVSLMASFAGAILLFTYLRKIPGGFLAPYIASLPTMAVLPPAVFLAFGVYRDMWGQLTLMNMARLAVAAGLAAFGTYVFMRWTWGVWPSPIIGVTAFYLFFTFSGGIRVIPALLSTTRRYFTWKTWGNDGRTPLLIVGAGSAASALILDMQNQGRDCPYRIVGAVDDDPAKQKQTLRGVPVLGRVRDIQALSARFSVREIIIAVPSATTEQRRGLIVACAGTGCRVRSMSAVSQVEDATMASLHNLNAADLIGRREIRLDPDEMATYLTGGVVLVTGGGGSIGSELCRQIMRFSPRRLVIFDIIENGAYDLKRELSRLFPERARDVEIRIGSVQDRLRLNEVFQSERPEIVFHAAAYKHVPLMEECPELAIQNNVFGTYNVANACLRCGARRFVMISTDKAVNPTNVMGASKRLAELTIQSMNGQGTEFVAVRFGNVLGSNGSVVPLFQQQIEAGGPVTVMHPDIIRYFMTIAEAAQLVLQAGAMAKGGETFVLDMGEPVRILDLATSMIEMAGLEPYTDIPIEFTGLRPGEKLYEELLLDSEGVHRTKDKKIFVIHAKPLTNMERRDMIDKLHSVITAKGNIREVIHGLIPDYVPGGMGNPSKDQAAENPEEKRGAMGNRAEEDRNAGRVKIDGTLVT